MKILLFEDDADDHLKAISQTDIEIGLPKNNKDQKKAIKMALTKRFSLIHGPPGTSLLKSTILVLMLQHQHRSLVICFSSVVLK